jgi:hypothetical protein
MIRLSTVPKSLSSSMITQKTTNQRNNPPVISNPIPVNGSTGINLIPRLKVIVDDPDGNLLTAHWYWNGTGIIDTSNHTSSVSTSTNHWATAEPQQKKSFFAAGCFWVFYSNNSDTSKGRFVYRSSTDGVTWSTEQTTINQAMGGGYCDSIWYNGTYVAIAQADATDIYYRRGKPNFNGTITWNAATQIVSTTYHSCRWPTITVDSNGYTWIGYCDYSGGNKPSVIRSGNTDGTWGTTPEGFPYLLNSTIGLDNPRVVVVNLTGGKILAEYMQDDATKLTYARVWNGSTWWGSEKETPTWLSSSWRVSMVPSGDNVYLVGEHAYSNYSIILTKYTYTMASWSAFSNVSYCDYNSSPLLSIDYTTGDLYCFWFGYPTRYHVYCKRCHSGVWDPSPTDWITEQQLTELPDQTHEYSVYAQAYNNKIGILYMRNHSSPYTVRFAYLDTHPWNLFGTDVNIDTSGGAVNITQINNNCSEYNTKYWWKLNVTDGSLYTTCWYCFTTKSQLNQPPNPPTITGPVKAKIKIVTRYNFTTKDPDDNNVSYFIDWGDNTTSGWVGPYASGATVSQSHTWTTKGTYTIKAKAKDIYGNESNWSTLQVIMPLSYGSPQILFFAWLFERFPHAFPILRILIGY